MDEQTKMHLVCQQCKEDTNAWYAYFDKWICFQCLTLEDPEYARLSRAADTELRRYNARQKKLSTRTIDT